MKNTLRNVGVFLAGAILASGIVWAQQTNYLGAVFISDPVTPTQQAKVSSAGHLIVDTSAAVYSLTALGCQSFGAVVSSGWPSVPAGATVAFMSIEGASVRMRDDGTNPTSSVGVLFLIGGPWPYQGPLAATQFIQTGATATINVCFYK